MNTVQLIGRLTKDVELKFTTQAGKAVGSFTLAVNRNFKNAQGEYEADFIQCVVWDKKAENLANFTHKGSQIGVEGRIQTRNYENQQGQRVYVTEIVVGQFHLLDPRESQNNPQNSYQNNNQGNYQGSNYNAQNGQNMANNNQSAYQQQGYNDSYGVQDATPVDIEDQLPF